MRIPCPFCGPRDSGEFTYRGDAAPRRPEGNDVETRYGDAMFEYVYLRDNLAGAIREHWYHGAGCRQWLVVTRDTRTHRITDAAFAKGAA